MHIKNGDKVVVISGKDSGKIGKVMRSFPNEERVIVEGVNIQTKHKKPMGPTEPGGIIQTEGAIRASKVMLYCDKDKQGVRTSSKTLENGKKVRVCKKCGETLGK